jgi:hypothetical protein
MILNPLSQWPAYTCDYCHKQFEEGDEFHKDEDGNDMCEECWHEAENHAQCDECGEWIEGEAYLDDEDSKCFCNQDCQVSYYSAKLSELAGL